MARVGVPGAVRRDHPSAPSPMGMEPATGWTRAIPPATPNQVRDRAMNHIVEEESGYFVPRRQHARNGYDAG
jgi:hypothetical protein